MCLPPPTKQFLQIIMTGILVERRCTKCFTSQKLRVHCGIQSAFALRWLKRYQNYYLTMCQQFRALFGDY